MALAEAGDAARGSTAYVTLEPCAHVSARGPDCAGSLVAAGIARCVVAMEDPDPRTAGAGIARMRAAGIAVATGVRGREAARDLAGFARRVVGGRPELTLKLALSLDGRVALADGRSQWITGPVARTYGHRLRARADLVLVGGGTFRADNPRLDVRLPGHDGPQPIRAVLTRAAVPAPFLGLPTLNALDALPGINHVLCEGGGRLAATLLSEDRVDRLVLLRAPILIGRGRGLEGLVLDGLDAAHGRWALEERRPLGEDLLEVFRRNR
jgi:diaminohydroxyphosphoribosylaminopyrimidine deaminase/5-amino-6-(5-phosphoribosylamino)uracil reductase